jgi:hypothetical protein
MGIYINPENSSFKRAINSPIYVDKTELLGYTNRVLGTEQCCMCVSRPRRFGKSMTAGMLSAYYSKGCDSRELFKNLKITEDSQYENHLNKYDVIHLDLTTFKQANISAETIVQLLSTSVIEELIEAYPDILASQENYLPAALAKLNQKAGISFIIIIDEWDMLFREYKEDTKAQEEYVDLLRGLFKAEPSKHFIKLAYITGILPIKRYSSESALNNFDEFTMTSPKRLAEYIGFTEDEVYNLCQEYDMDFGEAKRWYDGYSFSRLQHVYSPNSVVKAMLSGEYENYWTNTVAYESLLDLISMDFDGLRECVIKLLAGEHIQTNIDTFENDMTGFHTRDDVLTGLIHLGYLAYDYKSRKVYIPNEEVKSAFFKAIKRTKWSSVIQACKASDKLLDATIRGDAEAVAEGIDAVHRANTSILNYNDENALSCVITLTYYNAMNDYTLIRELTAGLGYADIVFIPKIYSDKPAMIVELKYNKTAEGAIRQIKDKKYVDSLKDYQGRILLVGINYDEKSKKHSCVIEEYSKI